jgi:hypothetical protein
MPSFSGDVTIITRFIAASSLADLTVRQWLMGNYDSFCKLITSTGALTNPFQFAMTGEALKHEHGMANTSLAVD